MTIQGNRRGVKTVAGPIQSALKIGGGALCINRAMEFVKRTSGNGGKINLRTLKKLLGADREETCIEFLPDMDLEEDEEDGRSPVT